jgi:Zn-dependent M16 (insulinase) family peptidase
MDYAEVSSLLAATVGGFNAILHTGSAAPSASGELANLAGRDWLIYRLKCLDDKTSASLDIVQRLINEAGFSDIRRIKDLIMEMKNDMRSGFSHYGNSYASCRAGRFTSLSSQTKETWNGITQLEFAHRLAGMDIAQAAAKLQYLRESIVSGGIIANITGSAKAIKSGGALLAERFSGFGAPKQRKSAVESSSSLGDIIENNIYHEVFASPSLQIGFAAMTLQPADFDTREQTAETVLAHYLSTGALWEHIRMKGGAYGAKASSDSLERCFSLSTYRDPNPLRSLDSFSAVLKGGCSIKEDDLVKTIIGCYARETRPSAPAENGITDFLRFLSRIKNDYRKRRLERLISVSAGDIDAALGKLALQTAGGRVIIAGMKDAEQAAKALGAKIQTLPV